MQRCLSTGGERRHGCSRDIRERWNKGTCLPGLCTYYLWPNGVYICVGYIYMSRLKRRLKISNLFAVWHLWEQSYSGVFVFQGIRGTTGPLGPPGPKGDQVSKLITKHGDFFWQTISADYVVRWCDVLRAPIQRLVSEIYWILWLSLEQRCFTPSHNKTFSYQGNIGPPGPRGTPGMPGLPVSAFLLLSNAWFTEHDKYYSYTLVKAQGLNIIRQYNIVLSLCFMVFGPLSWKVIQTRKERAKSYWKQTAVNLQEVPVQTEKPFKKGSGSTWYHLRFYLEHYLVLSFAYI